MKSLSTDILKNTAYLIIALALIFLLGLKEKGSFDLYLIIAYLLPVAIHGTQLGRVLFYLLHALYKRVAQAGTPKPQKNPEKTPNPPIPPSP